jgi:ATP sulfurylase
MKAKKLTKETAWRQTLATKSRNPRHSAGHVIW